MIDINRIRNNKEEIEKTLLKRMDKVNLNELLEWDKEKRQIGTKLDEYTVISEIRLVIKYL